MAWTDRWRRLGNIGNRENLYLAEAMDDTGRKAVVREPKFSPNGDDNDINRGVKGLESEVAALRLLNAAGASVPMLYESQITRGGGFVAVEYVEGQTLGARLSSGVPLSEDEANRITNQLSALIKLAHSLEVYHRDLHPYNVMLRQDGRVVVIDWTISRIGKHYHRESAVSDRGILTEVRNALRPNEATATPAQIAASTTEDGSGTTG